MPAGRRHVWVAVPGGIRLPGLVVAWRRDGDGWQAQVALVRDDAVLVRWVSAVDLRPVTDDRWGRPAKGSAEHRPPAAIPTLSHSSDPRNAGETFGG